jgi:hypothetical protein
MKFSLYATVLSILALLYALALLFLPVQFISHYGLDLDAGAAAIARMFGASLAAQAIVLWLLRGQSPKETAGKAVLWSTFIYNLATLIITLNVILNKLVNSLAWSTAILNILIILISIYFLASKKQNS